MIYRIRVRRGNRKKPVHKGTLLEFPGPTKEKNANANISSPTSQELPSESPPTRESTTSSSRDLSDRPLRSVLHEDVEDSEFSTLTGSTRSVFSAKLSVRRA